MDISLFIAKALGLYMTVISLIFFFRRKSFEGSFTKIAENPATETLAGTIALLIGTLLVVGHNIWSPDATIVITILGWIIFIKGIVLLTFPGFIKRLTNKFFKKRIYSIMWMIVVFVIGIYLLFYGYSSPT